MQLDKIYLLEQSLDNTIMTMYNEILKKSANENQAKQKTALYITKYMRKFGYENFLVDEIRKTIDILLNEYKSSNDEEIKKQKYEDINTLTDALNIIDKRRD